MRIICGMDDESLRFDLKLRLNMGKHLTFFILSGTGTPLKQLSVRRSVLSFLGAFFIALAVVSSYLGHDYYQLKFTDKNPRLLSRMITNQGDVIAGNRMQLRRYADEINSLKSRLVTLNNFEMKLRIVANIGESDFQSSLFGVGGAMPEDMDLNIPAAEKHNSLIREMSEQVDQLGQAMDTQEENFAELYGLLDDQRNILASTPAIMPAPGWKSSQFGYRKSPFTGRRSLHKGLDIANRSGTEIVATADGVVTFAGAKGSMGIMMVVDHGYGMITRFGHLSKTLKAKGAAVKRGDVIARMGNTGRSTGPHVHYEVRLNGIPVNPQKYILD